MGQVYRARDMTLDRDVAIKVLPKAFTDDPDRLARFEREAKVLASLETFDSRIVTRQTRWRLRRGHTSCWRGYCRMIQGGRNRVSRV